MKERTSADITIHIPFNSFTVNEKTNPAYNLQDGVLILLDPDKKEYEKVSLVVMDQPFSLKEGDNIKVSSATKEAYILDYDEFVKGNYQLIDKGEIVSYTSEYDRTVIVAAKPIIMAYDIYRFIPVNVSATITQQEKSVTVPITKDSNRVQKLMESDCLTLKFSLEEAVSFPIGSWCEDEIFGRFEVTVEQMPKYNTSTSGYNYELRMDAWYRSWNNKMMMLVTQVVDGLDYFRKESSWTLVQPLREQMRQFCLNLQALGYIPISENLVKDDDTRILDKYVHIDEETTPKHTQSLLMSYNATHLLEALKQMADTWECEYWITSHDGGVATKEDFIIHFGKCSIGEQITLSLDTNIEKMEINNDCIESGRKLFMFGSSDNIPNTYRKVIELTADVIETARQNDGAEYVTRFTAKDIAGRTAKITPDMFGGANKNFRITVDAERDYVKEVEYTSNFRGKNRLQDAFAELLREGSRTRRDFYTRLKELYMTEKKISTLINNAHPRWYNGESLHNNVFVELVYEYDSGGHYISTATSLYDILALLKDDSVDNFQLYLRAYRMFKDGNGNIVNEYEVSLSYDEWMEYIENALTDYSDGLYVFYPNTHVFTFDKNDIKQDDGEAYLELTLLGLLKQRLYIQRETSRIDFAIDTDSYTYDIDTEEITFVGSYGNGEVYDVNDMPTINWQWQCYALYSKAVFFMDTPCEPVSVELYAVLVKYKNTYGEEVADRVEVKAEYLSDNMDWYRENGYYISRLVFKAANARGEDVCLTRKAWESYFDTLKEKTTGKVYAVSVKYDNSSGAYYNLDGEGFSWGEPGSKAITELDMYSKGVRMLMEFYSLEPKDNYESTAFGVLYDAPSSRVELETPLLGKTYPATIRMDYSTLRKVSFAQEVIPITPATEYDKEKIGRNYTIFLTSHVITQPKDSYSTCWYVGTSQITTMPAISVCYTTYENSENNELLTDRRKEGGVTIIDLESRGVFSYSQKTNRIMSFAYPWTAKSIKMHIPRQTIKVGLYISDAIETKDIAVSVKCGIAQSYTPWWTPSLYGDVPQYKITDYIFKLDLGQRLNFVYTKWKAEIIRKYRNTLKYDYQSSTGQKYTTARYIEVEVPIEEKEITKEVGNIIRYGICGALEIHADSVTGIEILSPFVYSLSGFSEHTNYQGFVEKYNNNYISFDLFYSTMFARNFTTGTKFRIYCDLENGATDYGVPYAYWVSEYDNPSSVVTIGSTNLQLPIVKSSDLKKYQDMGYISVGDYLVKDNLAYRNGYIIPVEFINNDDAVALKEIVAKDTSVYPDGKLLVKGVEVIDGNKTIIDVENEATKLQWNWEKFVITVKTVTGYDFTFNKDYILPNGEELKMRFLIPEDVKDAVNEETYLKIKGNCKLAGMQFGVAFHESTQNYEIVRNEDFGTMLPNNLLYPSVNDPCVLVNWNVKALASLGLIEEAEHRLLERAFEYYKALQDGNFTFTCDMMSDFLFENEEYEDYTIPTLGQKVSIKHKSLRKGQKDTRIIGMELKLDKPYDTPKLTCGETEAFSRLKQLEKSITKLSK